MSLILSLFWGPLCEIRDPHRTHTRGYSTAFKLLLSKGSSDHSELTSYKNLKKLWLKYKEDGIHHAVRSFISRFQMATSETGSTVAMSTLAATTMLRTTRIKRDSVKSTSTFNMLLIQVTFKSLTNSSVKKMAIFTVGGGTLAVAICLLPHPEVLKVYCTRSCRLPEGGERMIACVNGTMRAAQYAEKTSWLF